MLYRLSYHYHFTLFLGIFVGGPCEFAVILLELSVQHFDGLLFRLVEVFEFDLAFDFDTDSPFLPVLIPYKAFDAGG